MFLVLGSVLWNRLPATLKLPSSIPVFKRKIKKYLISQYFLKIYSTYSGLAIG